MKNDVNWDNYYDGYSPFEKEDIAEDCKLHINSRPEVLESADSVTYAGPKTNATVKQIEYYLGVKQQNSKFLYSSTTVVILLDYSEHIIDKWKKGTILYCYGEKVYSIPEDTDNLSLIDRKLFCSGSSGETCVYAFWKDTSKNYNFIYGILVLNSQPYQIAEGDGFRWIFPLILTSEKFFAMPEKYCFNVDISKIQRKYLKEDWKKDEQCLMDFNNSEFFDLSKGKPTYKGIPQKKAIQCKKNESLERNRKVAANALRIADFKCEYNVEHSTFIRRIQNIPYTEAHHIVPLSYAELFNYSLDIEENIVSLCSTCHNQIHYGKDAIVIIKKLFAERRILLENAGIILSEQELLSMYKAVD